MFLMSEVYGRCHLAWASEPLFARRREEAFLLRGLDSWFHSRGSSWMGFSGILSSSNLIYSTRPKFLIVWPSEPTIRRIEAKYVVMERFSLTACMLSVAFAAIAGSPAPIRCGEGKTIARSAMTFLAAFLIFSQLSIEPKRARVVTADMYDS